MSARSGNTLVKVLLWVCLIAAIPAIGFYYYRRNSAPKPPEYTTATIARGSVVQTVTASGQLDPLISVDVSSQISGLVKELYVDFNTPVKAGQKLAEIDPATYQQRLRQAEAELKSSQASNKLARLNATRTQELYDKHLVTQQEYDQAMAQLAQADAQLLTRQAAVVNAETDFNRCTLYSPIDGVVISKQTEIGKTVAASLNAPTLFVIANDLAKMQITAAVAEADIGLVQDGQEVTFTVDAFPGRTFRGKVSQVRNAPKNTQNVVTYDTIIDVDNRDLELRPGMTANASIVVARRDNTLRIPNSALRVRLPETIPVKQSPAPAEGAALAEAKGGERPKQVAANAGGSEEAKGGERRTRGEGGPRGEGGGRRGGMFGGANLTDEQRAKFREIMSSVGVDFRSGPPTAEQRAKLVEALTAAGLPVPENLAGGRSQPGTVTSRTVYRLPGGDKTAAPEAVTIRTGISDGSASELVGGLNEGDVIITSVYVPGAAVASSGPQQSNPFGGQRGGFGGGAGGGRRP